MFKKQTIKLSSVKHENLDRRINIFSENGEPKSLTDILRTQEYCVTRMRILLRRFETLHREQLIGVITRLSIGDLASIWYLGSTDKCRVMVRRGNEDLLVFCVSDYDTCAEMVLLLHYLGSCGYAGFQIMSAVLSSERRRDE